MRGLPLPLALLASWTLLTTPGNQFPLFKKLAKTRVPTAIGALLPLPLLRFFFFDVRAATRTPPPVLKLVLLLEEETNEEDGGGGLLLRGGLRSFGLGAGGGRGNTGVGSKRT